MATQGPTTGATPAAMTSRLTQMQMRFQQRQQQERDQRKVDMTSTTATVAVVASSNATHSETGSTSSTIRSSAAYTASSTTTAVSSSTNGTITAAASDLSASLGAGKVRQMFDERRHGQRGAGIDKSYPLQPIQPKATVASTNGSNISNGNGVANGNGTRVGAAGPNNKTRVPPISANTKARLALQQRQQQQQENGNGETLKIAAFDDNENLLDEEKFPDTISFDEDLSMTPSTVPMTITRKLPSKPSGPQNVNSLKLKPVPGRTPTTASLKASATKSAPKKTSTPAAAEPPPQSTSPSSTGARNSQTSSAKSSVSRASTGKSTMATSASRKPSVALSASPSAMDGPVPDGLVRCTICSRNFADDRIAKHREICQKTKSKKRRVFDITKQRVAGTDAEKYVAKKKATSGGRKSVTAVASSPAAATGAGAGAAKGKSDWRRKHEEFIQAIRAAKEMQAHLAKGGKLSDLPPPPPSENPDYVQCPHCSRRFNQSAAERHIPKCATMLHNKKKPPTKAKRF